MRSAIPGYIGDMLNLENQRPIGLDRHGDPTVAPPDIDRPSIPDKIPVGLGRPRDVDGAEPWHVVLWNDDRNTMDHVITALIKVVDGVDLQGAVQLMMTAHNKGSAYVATAPRERAELYREGLERFGMTATMERA